PRYAHPPVPPSFPTRRSSDLTASPELTLRAFALSTRAALTPQAFHHFLRFTEAASIQSPSYVDCRNGLAPFGQFTQTFLLFFTADRKSTRLNSSHGSISYAVF